MMEIEKSCGTCMYACTRGTSITLCDVCTDYDEYKNGDVEDYLKQQNTHRIKSILLREFNEKERVCDTCEGTFNNCENCVNKDYWQLSQTHAEKIAREIAEVIR